MTDIKTTLAAAVAAANAAGLAQWERDGKMDCGACGGAMLEFDARTKVAKAAEAAGLAYRSGTDVWLRLPLPDGVRSQHEAIPQAQHRAFRKTLTAAGFGKAIKRWWNYVD